jgi:polyphosphate kinase
MVRNLHHRVETVFPIYNPEIKQQIIDLIDIQLKDNVKARSLNFKKNNTYVTNDKEPFHSQIETYNYIKKLS